MEIEIQEEVVTQEPTPSQLDAEVAGGEIQGENVVTQEPSSPEVIAGVPIQAVHNVQAEALGGKVWTQLSQNFVNLDDDNEDHAKDDGIQRLTQELSLLRIEVRKWKSQVERYQEGMVSLVEHRKTIKELRERWEK